MAVTDREGLTLGVLLPVLQELRLRVRDTVTEPERVALLALGRPLTLPLLLAVGDTLPDLLARLRVEQGLGLPLPPARLLVALVVLERLRVGLPVKEGLVLAVRVAVAQTLGEGEARAEGLGTGERM